MNNIDKVIQPVPAPSNQAERSKQILWLATVEEGSTKKTLVHYLCTRVDRHASHVEMVGQLYRGPEDRPADELTRQELTAMISREQQTELMYPWSRIAVI